MRRSTLDPSPELNASIRGRTFCNVLEPGCEPYRTPEKVTVAAQRGSASCGAARHAMLLHDNLWGRVLDCVADDVRALHALAAAGGRETAQRTEEWAAAALRREWQRWHDASKTGRKELLARVSGGRILPWTVVPPLYRAFDFRWDHAPTDGDIRYAVHVLRQCSRPFQTQAKTIGGLFLYMFEVPGCRATDLWTNVVKCKVCDEVVWHRGHGHTGTEGHAGHGCRVDGGVVHGAPHACQCCRSFIHESCAERRIGITTCGFDTCLPRCRTCRRSPHPVRDTGRCPAKFLGTCDWIVPSPTADVGPQSDNDSSTGTIDYPDSDNDSPEDSDNDSAQDEDDTTTRGTEDTGIGTMQTFDV